MQCAWSVTEEANRVRRYRRPNGMTLIELIVAFGVLSIIATMAVPQVLGRLAKIKVDRAIMDLRTIGDAVTVFSDELGAPPQSLDELRRPIPIDPWGSPYRYLSAKSPKWKGKSRRDRFLVPLNSDFDLYSSGPDGESVAPLTAKASRDDIVRADDGGFYGRAEEY